MKRLAFVTFASISFALIVNPAHAQASHSRACAPPKCHAGRAQPVRLLFSGRSVYIGPAAVTYRLTGPTWSLLERYE
jgi:hypothetical protein